MTQRPGPGEEGWSSRGVRVPLRNRRRGALRAKHLPDGFQWSEKSRLSLEALVAPLFTHSTLQVQMESRSLSCTFEEDAML